jgi:hypothetical protein
MTRVTRTNMTDITATVLTAQAMTAYVAVTAAVITVPASIDGIHPPGKHIAGIGLLVAQGDGHRWRFRRRAHAIVAGEPEGVLLQWAANRLPANATLIGWNVDHALIPVLLDAAVTADAIIARDFVQRLYCVLSGGAVDLSLGYGGAGAPPLAAIAADMAIYAPSWDDDALSSAWATGAVDGLRRDLADEAMALWRVFVRTAGLAGMDAEAATDDWVRRRKQLRLVDRASGAS